MLNTVIFYILAGMAVLSASLMVTRRNTQHSAMFLTVTLFSASGIFLQLQSRLLFALELVLFAGVTMVLFFIAIQRVEGDGWLRELRFSRRKWMVLLIAIASGGEAGLMYWSIRKRPLARLLALTEFSAGKLQPTASVVLRSLFHTYLLSFEIAVVLLLIAAVGVITVNGKRA